MKKTTFNNYAANCGESAMYIQIYLTWSFQICASQDKWQVYYIIISGKIKI